MEKIVSMTGKEMRKHFETNKEKILTQLDAAPEFDDIPFVGEPIACGFAAFKEYLKQKGHSKTEKPKNTVSFRFAPDLLKELRSTGRGWQTRVNKYLAEGLKKGKLAAPTN